MDLRSEDTQHVQLRPEVLCPQRQNTGIGVMLVASAAMFFAVASSAFILRSQAPHRSRCVHRARPAQAIPVRIAPTTAPTMREAPTLSKDEKGLECGKPTVSKRADGTETVIFRACTPHP